MMKGLRDQDLRRWLWILLPGSLGAMVLGFWLGIGCGLLVTVVCALFWAALLRILQKRLVRIEELNEQIDRALHGDAALNLAACQEGELAVLRTQLQKLTVCLREQALQTQRDKEFLSDSIADISHQLRTPLTSLNLLGAMLAQAREDEAEHRRLLQQLNQLLRRIDWLVETLLKLSKIDAGTVHFRRESVEAADVLRQAAQPLAVAMDLREQRLTITGHGSYTGDGAWTAEALGNLLKNCMEHTPRGGDISAQIHQTALYTQIVIQDSGPGFAEQDIPHLFERFYKGVEAAETSFGIGLALAQRIIKEQNGTIRAQNHPAGGAVFTVRFYHSVV